MEIQPIAIAQNGFTDKFGIPRQSRETSQIETRIVFLPPYRSEDAIRGIQDFSHLWLIWEFSQVAGDRVQVADSKLTVRPPRLGGNVRMGVFATRSPYRPNNLGLTSVELLRVERTEKEGCVLVVRGADLLHGTPIYDIKPYLSFSDSHPDARNGFAEETKDYSLPIQWDTPMPEMDASMRAQIEEILSQDPRPAYQSDPTRVYKMEYAGWHVEFRVENDTVVIKKCIFV